jgi:GT2 family glycosyltransferase
MYETPGVSVVIPNYNGAQLLRENLPSVLAALEHWGGSHELIVVDDCSSDDSVRTLREEFPGVKLIVNAVNLGFSGSCNAGMREVRYPVALCINSDVKANLNLVEPLLRHFADGDVFAVTPDVLAEREGRNQGIVYGEIKKGFIRGGFAPLDQKSAVRENLYAVGACVAYDMKKYRALGGYAEIYTPYLFEDVDICYRAWKRGWSSVYEPGTAVYHYSSATIGKTKKRHKRAIYFRNRFLFHWINLSDPSLVLRHLLAVSLRLSVSFLWLDLVYYRAFFGALGRWREVAALRRQERPERRLTDLEVCSRTACAAPRPSRAAGEEG